MTIQEETKRLADLITRWGQLHIESTSATVAHVDETLYNVDGSNCDPKISGMTWKQLLISFGINGPHCYVTDPLPDRGSTHPTFRLGGHVTEEPSGVVPDGSTCYLMPMCDWHNNKYRDHVEFEHLQTEMLELKGYMTSEPAITFMARLPAVEPYSVVYWSEGEWRARNLTERDAGNLPSGYLPDGNGRIAVDRYVLFKRHVETARMSYTIHEVNLPTE